MKRRVNSCYCIVAAALLFATPQRATGDNPEDKREINNSRQRIKLMVPENWQIVESSEQKDHAWYVLQEKGTGLLKPTVGIWAGVRFIHGAPGGGNLVAGRGLAAAVWARQKTEFWAQGAGAKDPPAPIGAAFEFVKFGRTNHIVTYTKGEPFHFYGLSTEKRVGGPLTVAWSSPPDSEGEALQIVEKLLGKKFTK